MMKKCLLILLATIIGILSADAQSINGYKYIEIQHQEDSPKDIEKRMAKEFALLGFVVISSKEVEQLPQQEQTLVLMAEYICRQSVQCLFKIKLKNQAGEIIYEDEQVAAAGFMTRKNDRQSAIKKIFKQLRKLDYQFTPKQ